MDNTLKTKFNKRKEALKAKNKVELMAITHDLNAVKDHSVAVGKKVVKTSVMVVGAYAGIKVLSFLGRSLGGSKKKKEPKVVYTAPPVAASESEKTNNIIGESIKRSIAENFMFFLVSLARKKMQNEMSDRPD